MCTRLRLRLLIRVTGIAALLALGLACNLLAPPVPTATPQPPPTATPFPSVPAMPVTPVIPTATLPYPDVHAIFGGLCYNFLQTLSGQTLVFDSNADLAAFYDRADRSKQCPDAAIRQPFDFADRQIIGTVATGKGCRLDLTYDHAEMDDAGRQRILVFQSAVVGDCDYGLVHPLWLAVERPPAGYTTQLRLVPAS